LMKNESFGAENLPIVIASQTESDAKCFICNYDRCTQ